MRSPWDFFKFRFVISLKSRTERRAQLHGHLGRLNLDYVVFDAIDGRKNPHLRQYLTDSGVITPDCALRPGQLGCLASHRVLWEQMLLGMDGTDPFWVLIMEDDVRFHPKLTEQMLADYLSALPDDARFFRLAFLAHGSYAEKLVDCGPLWVRFTGITFTTICYAVHSDYLLPLLKHRFNGPVDCIALSRSYGMKRIDEDLDFYRYHNPVGDFEEYFYGIAASSQNMSDTAN